VRAALALGMEGVVVFTPPKKMIPHALFQFSLVGSRSAQGQRNTVGLEGGQWKHIIIVDDQSYYREK